MTMKVKAIEKKLKREVGGREVESDFHPTHHLHSRCGLEGRAEGYCRTDYLFRPHW